MDRLSDDTRAVSEATGVTILIGMTVVVTATVGLNVLVVSQQGAGQTGANFSYDYVESNSALIVTHAEGRAYPAGELVVEGPNAAVTWGELSGKNASSTVGPGDVVQVSEGTAYGERVTRVDVIRIYHAAGENRTQLSRWPAES